jgi:membrane fusion protein (multidrug efflux system)
VDVQTDAQPGRVFQGVVTRIYPQGSSTSRAVPIRVTISNAQGLLRPNMFAQGKITTAIHHNAVLIPRTAIVQAASDTSEEAGKARVFTVENGVASEHWVTLGLAVDKGDWVEVKGLAAPATVVVLGQNSLKDGQKVVATPQSQSTDSEMNSEPQNYAAQTAAR